MPTHGFGFLDHDSERVATKKVALKKRLACVDSTIATTVTAAWNVKANKN
jgi:hypothetical protein